MAITYEEVSWPPQLQDAIINDVHLDPGIHDLCRSPSNCEMRHSGQEGLTSVGAFLMRWGVDCDSPFCIFPHSHGSCTVTHADTLLAHLGSLTADKLKMAGSLVTGPSCGSCRTGEELHFSEWEIQEAALTPLEPALASSPTSSYSLWVGLALHY